MHTPIIAASVLISAALFAIPNSQPQPAAGPATPPVPGAPVAQVIMDASCQIRQEMRKLWTDHTVWTRDYIIAAVDDKPDADAALKRLLKNQDEIGSAMGVYYGKANGDKLAGLLKEHIGIAGEVVKAAKSKDDGAFKAADTRWRQNADEIADFLGSSNPNWQRGTLHDLMMMHLSTTTDEVKARLAKDWDKDVKAYDAVYDHILTMADALSDGIVKQYPDRFGGTQKGK